MAGGGNQDENPVAINVVAIVDIIFCLCLFFMCSLKFKPLDAKFDAYLPKTVGTTQASAVNAVIDEIRVVLSWNESSRTIERLFGRNMCPAGDIGDEKLRDLIAASYTEAAARGNPEVPLIVDAGPHVPWRSIVDVFDIGRDVGVQHLRFGAGTRLDK